MNLSQDLARRAEQRRPVLVGLIGCGEMGTDIVTQLSLMAGIELGVLAEMRVDMAWAALDIAGIPREAAQLCTTQAAAEDAMRAGRIAITADAAIACSAGQVDVIIDATGNPGVGAELSLRAMAPGHPVV